MSLTRREGFKEIVRDGPNLIEKALIKKELGRVPQSHKAIILPDHVEAAIFTGKGGKHIPKDQRERIARAITLNDLSSINMTVQQVIDLVDNKP